MIDFLVSNWKFLAALFGLMLEIILVLVVKKRPKIIDNSFLFRCAEWINEAENIYQDGKEKLAYVLSKAKEYLADNYNEKSVTEIIEWILTIPQKKEK